MHGLLVFVVLGLADVFAGRIETTSSVPASHAEPGDGDALVSGGHATLPSLVPWHVGIYRPNGPLYEQLCGGTLITPSLVVTAAHCFWDYTQMGPVENPTAYKVALGKIYREWHLDGNNSLVQRMDVRAVVLEPQFDGYVNRQLRWDIALVKLSRNATLSGFVSLATVDWTPGRPANGTVGVVAGWGLTEDDEPSDVLRSIELPYVDHHTCLAELSEYRFRRLLTSDKFCAGFTNQRKSVCRGDSGGGFVVVDTATMTATLRGIVSVDFSPKEFPRISQCYNLQYTGFTHVGEPRFLELIQDNLYDGPSPPCAPVLNTTTVVVTDCLLDYVSVDCSLPMPTGGVTVFRCPEGHKFTDGRSTAYVTCLKSAGWSRQTSICARETRCPALTPSPGQRIICHHADEVVNCAVSAKVGTTATVSCMTSYVASSDAAAKTATTCGDGGAWSQVLAACSRLVQECGRQSQRDVVIYGETVKAGTQPWNVHVYVATSGGPSNRHMCEGTLVTPMHVVTGAFDMSGHHPSQLLLGANKQHQDFDLAESESQTRGVSAVSVHPRYDTESRAHDIAVVVANASFVMTWAVGVACVDWRRAMTLPTTSDVIIVAAWRPGTQDTTRRLSTVQRFTSVPSTSCRRSALAVGRGEYVTLDKICARMSGNDSCLDYKGAGMLVKSDDKFYLRGVLSVWVSSVGTGHDCWVNRLQTFTDVRQHVAWLRDQVNPV